MWSVDATDLYPVHFPYIAPIDLKFAQGVEHIDMPCTNINKDEP